MNVLGVDTSCDDTAVAMVVDGRHICSSEVASQLRLHAEHGGVVPEVASRRHLDEIVPTVRRALDRAGMTLSSVDAIAATVGPGLAGSLMVGYNMARALALGLEAAFVPVNHLEGHIYSAWLATTEPAEPAPAFPLLVLIVSGGHTELVLMRDHGVYERLGATRDDAAGEAFDKVGRLLGLEYPGGPAIQRAAERAAPGRAREPLPRAWLRGSHDFSFSGLKTAVLHRVQAMATEHSAAVVDALAAEFQDSVADVLATKTADAARAYDVRAVSLCGGVAANSVIRARLRATLPDRLPLHVPPVSLCTDNAAMIAAAGFYRISSAVAPSTSTSVQPGLGLRVAPAGQAPADAST